MKKTIALLITIVLLTACVCALAEEARFVTVNEWLDAKGECGDCYMVVQIVQVLNPVLAVVGDETGTVNLYTGGETELIFDFSDHQDEGYKSFWLRIYPADGQPEKIAELLKDEEVKFILDNMKFTPKNE